MSIALEIDEARATEATIEEDELVVTLADGRRLAIPLSWYPRLASATNEELSDLRIVGRGIGIHWPLLDEDISVRNLLLGIKSNESAASLERWEEALREAREQRGTAPGPAHSS